MAIITYLQAHPAVTAALGLVVMGGLDLALALNPNLDSNGIFHAIYLFVKSKVSPTPPTAS